MSNSNLAGFYRMPMAQRRARVGEIAGLSAAELLLLSGEVGLRAEQANHMVENALGVMNLPLALCVYLRVDDRDRLVPMVIEEPSVVAGASHAAKLIRAGGGVTTRCTPAEMIGQVQLLEVPDAPAAERRILAARDEIFARANAVDPALVAVGGGVRDLEVRLLPPLDEHDPVGTMLVVHLIVDVRDAMGANAVNTMCERLAPRLEELSGGRARLRILSNLADRRLVVAEARVPLAALDGKGCEDGLALARGIEEASVFAERDPYRAATHNKGIMNGVDAVLLAFGQDWRAVEAGAHSYAARDGRYTALSRWRVGEGALCGRLEMPMTVGVIGGVAKIHPTVKVARRVARITSAAELASVAAAVGLAQNLWALRALAAEGIQTGHMRVHARNIAVEAGAVAEEVEQVAREMAARRTIDLATARTELRTIRSSSELAAARQLDLGARLELLRQRYLPRIMALIGEVQSETTPGGSPLAAMFAYHMETGGKRLRALLPLVVAEALGSDPAQLIPLSAACETLHNATLVHDDLQDGDQVRRDRPTIWSRHGEAAAINLGDAMFYYAVLTLQRLGPPPDRREAIIRRLLVETVRVIDGQEREGRLRQQDRPRLEDYYAMVEGKTSALFALPMAGAAYLCGASSEVVGGFEEAARHMGVLFQIQDDLLDLYGDKGRDARGSDIREGKRSVLVVHALQHASAADARRLTEILDRDRLETSERDIDEARRILDRAGALPFALEAIGERREQALRGTALVGHPALLEVVEVMCDRFLQPIQQLLQRCAKGNAA